MRVSAVSERETMKDHCPKCNVRPSQLCVTTTGPLRGGSRSRAHPERRAVTRERLTGRRKSPLVISVVASEVRDRPVSEEEAITYQCPRCYAREGRPCTYVHTPGYATKTRSERQCKRSHNERRAIARDARRHVYRDMVVPDDVSASQVTVSIMRAEMGWDQRERARLREWIAENYDLFSTIVRGDTGEV